MKTAVLLSGEHETLPVAELAALTGQTPELHGQLAFVDEVQLERAALVHAWGQHWGTVDDTASGLAQMADVVANLCSGVGSVAGVSRRIGHAKSENTMPVLRALGDGAVAAGHTIDLNAPDVQLYAWIQGGTIWFGRLLGENDRAQFEARIPDGRDHFSPVSMHPRRAASLVNLACPAPGTVLDPFCGTGGIVMEAVLLGHEVWASDLDAWMVQGTLQTLTDAGAEPLDANVFQADIGEVAELVGPVDAVVTDLPYGRASSTDLEAIDALYRRAVATIDAALVPGGTAVLGCANPDLLPETDHLRRFAVHAEYVHKSLTRHYVIMKKQGRVESP